VYRHILVPTDGSTLSLKAAKTAAALAARIGAKLSAVYVIEPYLPPTGGDGMFFYADAYSAADYDKIMARLAGKALTRLTRVAKGAKWSTFTLTDAQPWKGIIRAAKAKKCDLIVMASHGRRGIAGVILGSETSKVLTHSKVPVLVCR
jgi:nucleotide-binding universal stress UspA family protein